MTLELDLCNPWGRTGAAANFKIRPDHFPIDLPPEVAPGVRSAWGSWTFGAPPVPDELPAIFSVPELQGMERAYEILVREQRVVTRFFSRNLD